MQQQQSGRTCGSHWRLGLAMLALGGLPGTALPAVNVILDSDMGPDVDDAGAIAMLHTYASLGQVNILATLTANGSRHSAVATDIINNYFGRGNIPVGMNHSGVGVSGIDDSGWARAVAISPTFANLTTLDTTPTASIPNATTVYRQVLSAAPDQSVDVVVIGWQSNLSNLLNSGPDGISSLTGAQLVQQKVRKLTIMGGSSGDGFNIARDPAAAANVAANWSGPHTWSGTGREVLTGRPLLTGNSATNPIAAAFLDKHNQNRFATNGSWDQVALLNAVEGNGSLFTVAGPGTVSVSLTPGYTSWSMNPAGRDYRVSGVYDDALTWRIDQLMTGQAPTPYPNRATPGVAFDYTFAFNPDGYVDDVSGQGAHGTLFGSSNVFVAGAGDVPSATASGWVSGGGMRFDANGARQYVHVPVSLSSSDGMFSRSFRLEAWASHENATGGFSPLLGMSDPDLSDGRFYLAKQANAAMLALRVGNVNVSGLNAGDIADGALHHYVLLYDRDQALLRLIVDGALVREFGSFSPGSGYLGSLRVGNVANNENDVWDGTVSRVKLTYVPEPGLSAVALGAGASLLARGRRRAGTRRDADEKTFTSR